MSSGNKILNKVLNHKTTDKSKAAIPERIKETRIYRGLTQRELGEKIGLTRQAINSYEAGTNVPPLNILLEISKIVDFPINFFYKERVVCEEQGEVYFRSSAIPCKTKDMLELKLKYLSTEIMHFIEKYINLPKLNLIDVEYKEEYSMNDIINIAKTLREYWGLNDKPVKNLTYVMQENGCIIARLNLNSEKTDGYSKWLFNRPYTFLNTQKNAAVRTRFTLAHELGHIILHHNLRDGEDIRKREKEANYFASEFLFPSEAVINEISFVSLDSLIPIKNKWGISVGAIVRRCLDLELITEERYTTLQKQISKRKWRTFEPLDDIIKCEEPQLFSEAFKLLLDNGIVTKAEIQNSILFSEDELINICCLEPNFFEENKLSIKTRLKIVK